MHTSRHSLCRPALQSQGIHNQLLCNRNHPSSVVRLPLSGTAHECVCSYDMAERSSYMLASAASLGSVISEYFMLLHERCTSAARVLQVCHDLTVVCRSATLLRPCCSIELSALLQRLAE